MRDDLKIYIAGHKGMVGSAIYKQLERQGYRNFIFRTSQELDLRNQTAVYDFMAQEKPDAVILAAAKVGGIIANSRNPYTFLFENLVIESNVIHAAHINDIDQLIFLGSSCIYPKMAPQPLKEEYLLTGPLEPTNEGYAIAKIAGLKLCESIRRQYGRNYVSLMPTNLYGPRDNFDLQTSHVLPAMLRKFQEALPDKPVTLWGSGDPKREFLHVDDLASAVSHILKSECPYNLYNVGTGKDISIKELAGLVRQATGHEGEIRWDRSKPDGTPRKLLDISRITNMGWKHNIELEDGIAQTFTWFLENEVVKKESP